MSNRVVSTIVAGAVAAAVVSLSPHVASARAMTPPPQKTTLALKTGLSEECYAVALAGQNDCYGGANASRAGVHGLTWSLFQTPPRAWADGQPVGLLAALGPSNLRYGEVRGGQSPVDTGPPLVAGWTRPLGLRLAIRW
jgi:uncharacterized membrane protein